MVRLEFLEGWRTQTKAPFMEGVRIFSGTTETQKVICFFKSHLQCTSNLAVASSNLVVAVARQV